MVHKTERRLERSSNGNSTPSAFLPSSSLAAAIVVARAPAGWRPPSLPPGKGRALVEQVCPECYGLGTSTAQHMSRGQWDEAIGAMISLGVTTTDEQFERIAEYLAKNSAPVANPKVRGQPGKAQEPLLCGDAWSGGRRGKIK